MAVTRTVLGLPLLFFLPGYALSTVVFPREPESEASLFGSQGIDGIERAALSLGLSVALLPVVGLTLALYDAIYDPVSIVVALSTVVVVGMVLGTVRRIRLPTRKQFRVPFRTWGNDLYGALFKSGVIGGVLTLLLIVSVVAATGGLVYAVAVPGVSESYTTLMLLSEDDSGELVASDYPTEFTIGETRELTVVVENHESSDVEYTVVAELQRVRTDDGDVTVLETEELGRERATVADGETHRWEHAVSPTLQGEGLRLTYLLYEGDAPENPTTVSAEEHTYLWVNVTG
jgi:uncharacterized membrane protein